MKNKLEIQFGDHKIVAEIYGENEPGFPPELTVYVADKNGVIMQDICLVRPHYGAEDDEEEIKVDNNFVDCLVWTDDQHDDYTHKLIIPVSDGEETGARGVAEGDYKDKYPAIVDYPIIDEDEPHVQVVAYFTEDENEEGEVIAIVKFETKEVEYWDDDAKTDSHAQEFIDMVLKKIDDGDYEGYYEYDPQINDRKTYDFEVEDFGMTKERAVQLLQIMIDHLVEYEDCRRDSELTNLLMAIGFAEEDLKYLGFDLDAMEECEE